MSQIQHTYKFQYRIKDVFFISKKIIFNLEEESLYDYSSTHCKIFRFLISPNIWKNIQPEILIQNKSLFLSPNVAIESEKIYEKELTVKLDDTLANSFLLDRLADWEKTHEILNEARIDRPGSYLKKYFPDSTLKVVEFQFLESNDRKAIIKNSIEIFHELCNGLPSKELDQIIAKNARKCIGPNLACTDEAGLDLLIRIKRGHNDKDLFTIPLTSAKITSHLYQTVEGQSREFRLQSYFEDEITQAMEKIFGIKIPNIISSIDLRRLVQALFNNQNSIGLTMEKLNIPKTLRFKGKKVSLDFIDGFYIYEQSRYWIYFIPERNDKNYKVCPYKPSPKIHHEEIYDDEISKEDAMNKRLPGSGFSNQR